MSISWKLVRVIWGICIKIYKQVKVIVWDRKKNGIINKWDFYILQLWDDGIIFLSFFLVKILILIK